MVLEQSHLKQFKEFKLVIEQYNKDTSQSPKFILTVTKQTKL